MTTQLLAAQIRQRRMEQLPAKTRPGSESPESIAQISDEHVIRYACYEVDVRRGGGIAREPGPKGAKLDSIISRATSLDQFVELLFEAM